MGRSAELTVVVVRPVSSDNPVSNRETSPGWRTSGGTGPGGEFQERYLPRPTALRVGVKVELVHDHGAQLGRRAFAQGDVGQDFRRAADDGGASWFTPESPVIMPTFSAPKISQSAKNFSETSALIGGAV